MRSSGLKSIGIPVSVSVGGPTTGFGAVRVAGSSPRIQLLADYGLQSTDTQSVTLGTGSVTSAEAMFIASTGAGAGSSAAVVSRRVIRYRAGESVRLLFTAMYSSAVASSSQYAGAFSQTEGLLIGYQGTEFGVLRRIAGTVAIKLLTVTVGTGGAEVITLTLDGADFVLPSTGGALSTTALAQFIANQTGTLIAGWSEFQAQAVGATVQFFQDSPATTPGDFAMSSDGTAAGTWSTVTDGSPNDDTSGSGAFIPQSQWNVDKFDGTGPSRMRLDPESLNVFDITLTYLGAGPIEYSIMAPNGTFSLAHRVKYPNENTTPSMRGPSMRIGWQAASLGSTTDLTVSGASAAAFLEGELVNLRDPFNTEATHTATVTEAVLFAIRVRGEFGGAVCLREIAPIHFGGAVESANRICYFRVVLNPTFAGDVVWARLGSASAVDVTAPAAATRTGGTVLTTTMCGGGSGVEIDLAPFGIRCEAGDVIAVCTQMVSITSTVSGSLTWHEA